jgi:hypothetical protein
MDNFINRINNPNMSTGMHQDVLVDCGQPPKQTVSLAGVNHLVGQVDKVMGQVVQQTIKDIAKQKKELQQLGVREVKGDIAAAKKRIKTLRSLESDYHKAAKSGNFAAMDKAGEKIIGSLRQAKVAGEIPDGSAHLVLARANIANTQLKYMLDSAKTVQSALVNQWGLDDTAERKGVKEAQYQGENTAQWEKIFNQSTASVKSLQSDASCTLNAMYKADEALNKLEAETARMGDRIDIDKDHAKQINMVLDKQLDTESKRVGNLLEIISGGSGPNGRDVVAQKLRLELTDINKAQTAIDAKMKAVAGSRASQESKNKSLAALGGHETKVLNRRAALADRLALVLSKPPAKWDKADRQTRNAVVHSMYELKDHSKQLAKLQTARPKDAQCLPTAVKFHKEQTTLIAKLSNTRKISFARLDKALSIGNTDVKSPIVKAFEKSDKQMKVANKDFEVAMAANSEVIKTLNPLLAGLDQSITHLSNMAGNAALKQEAVLASLQSEIKTEVYLMISAMGKSAKPARSLPGKIRAGMAARSARQHDERAQSLAAEMALVAQDKSGDSWLPRANAIGMQISSDMMTVTNLHQDAEDLGLPSAKYSAAGAATKRLDRVNKFARRTNVAIGIEKRVQTLRRMLREYNKNEGKNRIKTPHTPKVSSFSERYPHEKGPAGADTLSVEAAMERILRKSSAADAG